MAAAHEGTAELVISVVYENGGTTDVPLDRYASEVLLQACKVDQPDQLIGWAVVRDALKISYNRYS